MHACTYEYTHLQYAHVCAFKCIHVYFCYTHPYTTTYLSIKSRTILFDLICGVGFILSFPSENWAVFKALFKGGNQTISVHEISACDLSLCL